MNIFVLDTDPEQAAEWHCDRHINKMVIEYAQILSTAAWKNDFHDPDRMYKPVPHMNPKVHDWAAESSDNFIWLLKLARAVADEYEHRYGREHASYTKVISKMDISDIRCPSEGITERPLCMPDILKTEDDPVRSYRDFYIHGKDWRLSWFNRERPEWYPEHKETMNYKVEG
jgi:hypothetical protein